MHWSLAFHGKLSFAVTFSAHFLVLYPRQPWSLNKVFIHHMSCINKQNKFDKTNSGNCESKMSDWEILIFFPQTASHLSALLKIQFNCISSAYIMMKHCLLLNYFLSFSLYKHSQVSVLWWVHFTASHTRLVEHGQEHIYNHIQSNLSTSKQEQTAYTY